MLNSYIENIMCALWGHLQIPKHVESMQESEQSSAHNLLKSKHKSGSVGHSLGGHYELVPLGPTIKCFVREPEVVLFGQ
jgi:hypothetical protein